MEILDGSEWVDSRSYESYDWYSNTSYPGVMLKIDYSDTYDDNGTPKIGPTIFGIRRSLQLRDELV